jgi:hypothetical protein
MRLDNGPESWVSESSYAASCCMCVQQVERGDMPAAVLSRTV